MGLEGSQVGGGIVAEAMLRPVRLCAEVQFTAEGLPGQQVRRREVRWVHALTLPDDARQQAGLAAQHQAGVPRFAAGGSAFVVAGRPEGVLQIIVGARESGNVVAMEKVRRITGGHFEEVPNRGREVPLVGDVIRHVAEEVVKRCLHLARGLVGGILQQVRRAPHPGVGGANGRPEGGRRCEPVGEQSP